MISLLFKNSIIYSYSHVLYFEALMGFCYNSANAYLVSCVRFFVTPQTVACQAPLSMGILLARILEWVAMPSARGWSPHQGSHPGLPQCRWILYHLSHQQSPRILSLSLLQGIFLTHEANWCLQRCRWIHRQYKLISKSLAKAINKCMQIS